MELNNRRWYVTWFYLSLAILDRFQGDRGWGRKEDKYRNGTNLCHFIRVTLVWGPLVLALHLVVYGAAIAVLTIVPIQLFGWSGYFAIIAGIAGFIGILAGVVFMLWLYEVVKDFIANKRYEARLRRQAEAGDAVSEEAEESPTEDKGPTFIQLVFANIKAAKQQVCPTINFKG
jgi:hypothetical protein